MDPAGRPGRFVPGRPGDAAARGLDTEVRPLVKRCRPPPGSSTWSPGLQAPRVRAGSSHSCKEAAKYLFQTFHGSKLSASIKRSGVRGKSILGISMQMNGPGFQLRSGFPPPRAWIALRRARRGSSGRGAAGGPEFEFQTSALWSCVLVPVIWPL
uniref:Uncharacterized protein n=1 Tax=Equus caballus TaxID=9796 RepID=A0A9L0RCV3_HORSE